MSNILNKEFQQAAYRGDADMVRSMLLDPRIDPTDFYDAPLRDAIHGCHYPIVKMLVDDGRCNASLGICFVRPDMKYDCRDANDCCKIIKLLISIPGCPKYEYADRILVHARAHGCTELMEAFAAYDKG